MAQSKEATAICNMAPINIRINPLGGAVVITLVLVFFFYIFGLPEFLTLREERVSMKELLSASVVLARRGGDRVREIRRDDTLQEKVKGETKEGAKELVSRGDMESHNAIFYGFAKVFPGLNVSIATCYLVSITLLQKRAHVIICRFLLSASEGGYCPNV